MYAYTLNLQPSSSSSSLEVEKKDLVQLHLNTGRFNSSQERSSSVIVPATLSPSRVSEEEKNKNKIKKFMVPSQIMVRASISLSLISISLAEHVVPSPIEIMMTMMMRNIISTQPCTSSIKNPKKSFDSNISSPHSPPKNKHYKPLSMLNTSKHHSRKRMRTCLRRSISACQR